MPVQINEFTIETSEERPPERERPAETTRRQPPTLSKRQLARLIQDIQQRASRLHAD